jgi:hypothetical protein
MCAADYIGEACPRWRWLIHAPVGVNSSFGGFADSTGRCNACVKSFCRCFKIQSLSWPLIQFASHRAEFNQLNFHRQDAQCLREDPPVHLAPLWFLQAPGDAPSLAEIARVSGLNNSLRDIAASACNRLSNTAFLSFSPRCRHFSQGMEWQNMKTSLFSNKVLGGAPERLKLGTGELKSYCHKEVSLLLFGPKRNFSEAVEMSSSCELADGRGHRFPLRLWPYGGRKAS